MPYTRQDFDVQAYTLASGANGCFAVTSPTGNCQFSSIANYVSLSEYRDQRLEKLKVLQTGLDKRMMLIDIATNRESYVTEIFPEEDIVMRNPYISTNGSHMTIFLVKTTVLTQR